MIVGSPRIMRNNRMPWIFDPNYMTEETPQLQIIAINGVVER